MKKVYAFMLCATVFAFLALTIYAEKEKRIIASSVLRIHVVAESNSEKDQAIKLKVRDAVLAATEKMFEGVKSKDEAMTVVNGNKSVIEKAAKEVLLKEGCTLPVKVNIEKTKFPLKIYENIRLPGGVYDAVNVKIGKAKGENWWCIMYPVMCFSDGITGRLDAEGERELKEELGEERFRLITDTEDRKIKIKFKILEIF